MKIKCPYCGNVWNYHGSAKNYASCPKCGKQVRLHGYLKKGYKPFSPLKFRSKNYLPSEVKVIYT